MRLLVLGGTVFLSRAVAEEAVRRGHDVVCACRGASGSPPEGVRHLPLDRTDPGAGAVLAAEAGRVDAVVDVARTPSWVRSAVGALPDAYWLFVSSISVYADSATPGGTPETLPVLDAITTDEDWTSAPEVYGGMKVACEEIVTAGTAVSCVVRPGLVVGPGDPSGRFTYWPDRIADAEHPEVLVPDFAGDPVQVIDVRDLAAWIVDLAEARRSGVFDAVAEAMRRDDFLDQIRVGLDAGTSDDDHRDFSYASHRFLAEQAVEPWAGPRSLPLWLTTEDAGVLAHDVRASYAAGLRPRPLAETARDTLAWLRATPGATVTGLTREEEREVLTALNNPLGVGPLSPRIPLNEGDT